MTPAVVDTLGARQADILIRWAESLLWRADWETQALGLSWEIDADVHVPEVLS